MTQENRLIIPICFEKIIVINNKSVWAAKHSINGEKVVIIPDFNKFVLENNNIIYFAYEPREEDRHLKIDGVSVYKTRILPIHREIISTKNGLEIVLLKGNFFFPSRYIKNEGRIVVFSRIPNKKYGNYFSLVWIENSELREKIYRYWRKNNLSLKVSFNNNDVIEIKMEKKNDSRKDYDEFLKKIMEPFKHYLEVKNLFYFS